MKDRIIHIMKSEGLSNAEFADKIGISTSSLSHIFSGRNNPSLDVVTRIHKAYPNINLLWLLYGEGEPDLTTGENGSENREFTYGDTISFDFRTENPSQQEDFGHKPTEKETVRYIEKPHPKITEIRIFFDNGTYEVFKPDSSR